ncbi:MAG: Asp-tRNA(Asn)/Glu-tRNA(Gln) amidotransferase subunit GatC [Candidatus Blackburnbacteria bacterium]|nr:Asp-tRNA(Asn)/Glu-tRNA(Gln) amidotransferase subunit GatC [Candidatus Blackburnbacteria bacterium]
MAKLSQLTQLPLNPKEESALTSQVESILEYVEQLSKVDTSGIEPTFSPTDLKNVTRSDEPQAGLSQEEALKNAKEVRNGMFVVPTIKQWK